MPLILVRNDITKMKVDAIVNSTNEKLIPGGSGVDASVHTAAGPELLDELRKIEKCPAGEAVITKGYALPCRYVIHTAAPIWKHGGREEMQILRNCYFNSLDKALQYGCSTVAVPILAAGANHCPEKLAFDIASEAVRAWLAEKDITVYLVVFNDSMLKISGTLFSRIQQYIDHSYVEQHRNAVRIGRERRNGISAVPSEISRLPVQAAPEKEKTPEPGEFTDYCAADFQAEPCTPQNYNGADAEKIMSAPRSEKKPLPDFMNRIMRTGRKKYVLDEGFGEALVRLQNEKDISSAKLCYRANITKAVLSNIKQSVPGGSKAGYRPTKSTAIAVGIALGLRYAELNDFIGKAGYTLSRSFLADQIVEYCIENDIFDIYTINEVLYDYDQALLGSA